MNETTYLQTELAKAQRSFKIGAIAMVIVLVGFGVYFQWMKGMLAEVLEPDSIAEFAVNEARGALPGLTEALKMNLTTEAPNVVRFVLHQGVDQVLPLVSQTLYTHLEGYSRDVTALAGEKASEAFQASLLEFKKQPTKVKKEDNAALAARLSGHVVTDFGSQLDAVAKDGVKKRLDGTAETLKHINSELTSMATTPVKDQKGMLGKRLITTWWTFVDRGRPNVPATDLAALTAVKGKPGK